MRECRNTNLRMRKKCIQERWSAGTKKSKPKNAGTRERKHFRNVHPSLPATIHAQAKTTVGKSSKKLYRMNAIIITLVVDVQNNTKNKGASELLISS